MQGLLEPFWPAMMGLCRQLSLASTLLMPSKIFNDECLDAHF